MKKIFQSVGKGIKKIGCVKQGKTVKKIKELVEKKYKKSK